MTAGARMSPEREAELRAAHHPVPAMGDMDCAACSFDDGYVGLSAPHPCAVIEALDALAAERDAVAEQEKCTALAQKELQEQIERTQKREVPLSAAHGFALHVRSLGDSFVILDGDAGAELFPSVQAAIEAVPLYDGHGEVVTPVALVPTTAWAGADGRVGA